MVKQGDIVKVNFNPQAGHEQAGYRPALVISNDFFNEKTSMAIVCPITNTNNRFPLHIPLDSRTQTTGVILCEHIKALDLNARPHRVVERLPEDLLRKVIDVVFAEIEAVSYTHLDVYKRQSFPRRRWTSASTPSSPQANPPRCEISFSGALPAPARPWEQRPSPRDWGCPT